MDTTALWQAYKYEVGRAAHHARVDGWDHWATHLAHGRCVGLATALHIIDPAKYAAWPAMDDINTAYHNTAYQLENAARWRQAHAAQ